VCFVVRERRSPSGLLSAGRALQQHTLLLCEAFKASKFEVLELQGDQLGPRNGTLNSQSGPRGPQGRPGPLVVTKEHCWQPQGPPRPPRAAGGDQRALLAASGRLPLSALVTGHMMPHKL
jgi:hypothetical protein